MIPFFATHVFASPHGLVMEREADDPLPSCHGNDPLQPFFCPHSAAYPALESQESGRTE
jgi:hypothetical protein